MFVPIWWQSPVRNSRELASVCFNQFLLPGCQLVLGEKDPNTRIIYLLEEARIIYRSNASPVLHQKEN